MNDTAHRGMKAKTIKAILAKKFNSFASSIEDEVVRKLVEKNTIITGGCIASMLLGEKINDFDLYFTDHATTKAVAEYYVKRFEVKNRSGIPRSEEHTSELQSLMRISYAVFSLKKKKQ